MCTASSAQYTVTSESWIHEGNFYFLCVYFHSHCILIQDYLPLVGHRITYLATLESLSPALCHSLSSHTVTRITFSGNTALSLPHPRRRAHCGYKIETPSLLFKASHSCSPSPLPLLYPFCPGGHCLPHIQPCLFCLCWLHTVTGPPQLLSLEHHLFEELTWNSLSIRKAFGSYFFMPCPAALLTVASIGPAISGKFPWPGKLLSPLVGKGVARFGLDGLDSKLSLVHLLAERPRKHNFISQGLTCEMGIRK